jgi:hypothetical protein
MFSLSSADLNVPPKTDQEINIPIRFTSHEEKFVRAITPKERTPPAVHDTAAACDDDGHIFVYDSNPNQIHNHINEEQPGRLNIYIFKSINLSSFSATLPRKTERIHQWLSSCEIKESNNISPTNQVKMRCISKSVPHPASSLQYCQDKTVPPSIKNETEPGRFRSCLKIHLETNESPNHRSRQSSSTSKHHQRHQIILDEDLNTTDDEYFERNTLSPSFQRDHQAVYL